MKDDPSRDFLLRLIEAAPDPSGFGLLYLRAWQMARLHLRATCPNHIEDDTGTCPNCHSDTAK